MDADDIIFCTFFCLLILPPIAVVVNSVVCCVQFSADGRFVATGCNRTAQIFDVQTGHRIWCVIHNFSLSLAIEVVDINSQYPLTLS